MWYSGPSFSPSHPKTRDVWILATPLHINLNNHHPPQHTHIFPPLLAKPVQTDKMGHFCYKCNWLSERMWFGSLYSLTIYSDHQIMMRYFRFIFMSSLTNYDFPLLCLKWLFDQRAHEPSMKCLLTMVADMRGMRGGKTILPLTRRWWHDDDEDDCDGVTNVRRE